MIKKIVAFLLGFYIFFTYYNTLIPFHFDYGLGDLPAQISQISWAIIYFGTDRASFTDIVGNIILFMPFGLLMYLHLHYRSVRGAMLLTVLCGALLSLSIEIIQLFIQSRNSAMHDLFNNTMGSLFGAIAAAVYARAISRNARRIFYDLLNHKPFLLIVAIIGVAQTIAAAIPFTVSITVSHLKRNLKMTNLSPFDYNSISNRFFNFPLEADTLPWDYTLMIEEFLFWTFVGYLLMIAYQRYWKETSYGRQLLFGLPLLYFPILEGMQLIILSRTTDVNDLISGWGGVLAGYGIYLLCGSLRRSLVKDDLDELKIPLAIFLVFILFSGLRPFDWSLAPEVLAHDLETEHLIPFYAYFRSTSLWNIYDIINGLTYFLPISLFWSYRRREAGQSFAPIYLKTTFSGLLIGLLIEGSQLLSLARIAEITDVLNYGIGGALGTFLIYYYEAEVRGRLAKIRLQDPA